MKIKNQELIKQLIKDDYNIDLDMIESFDYILTRTNCKTIDDYNVLLKYLQEYTEWTQKRHEYWTFSYTLDAYYRFLKAFEHTKINLMPKEDFYYLADRMEISVLNTESLIAKECAEEAFEYVKKYYYQIGEL